MERLLTLDFSALGGAIVDIFRDPSANPTAVALLIAGITLVAGLVIVLVLLLLPSEEEEEVVERSVVAAPPPEQQAVDSGTRTGRLASTTGVGFVIFVLVWIAGGFTTSHPEVCRSCHVETVHTAAAEYDPHVGVGCVRCHEPGGLLRAYTLEVPARAYHQISGMIDPESVRGYGKPVVSSGCSTCHAEQIESTITNERRGFMVSHVEPLEAGAECVDCHTLNAGTVSSYTVGMSSCLRCHNGRDAEDGCDSCHLGDVGLAARPREPVAALAPRNLIETPDCGGCHNEAISCDPCHGGVRMPHTPTFMASGHAREAVEDIWDNDGQACGRCHYEGRRSCDTCHGSMPGHPLSWKEGHQSASPEGCSQTCHQRMPGAASRNFCELCH